MELKKKVAKKAELIKNVNIVGKRSCLNFLSVGFSKMLLQKPELIQFKEIGSK